MTLPLVVLAGLSHRRRRAQPAVHRPAQVPRALARAGRRARRGPPHASHRREGRCWPSSPPSAALVGIAVAVHVYLRRRVEDRPGRARGPAPRGWYYDDDDRRLRGRPGRKALRGRRLVRPHVIDGAVNGVGCARAQRSARGLRRVQTGYVRSYALGVAVGAVVLVARLHRRGAACCERARRRGRSRRASRSSPPSWCCRPSARVVVALVSQRRPESARLVAAAVLGRHRRAHRLHARRRSRRATPASSSSRRPRWINDLGISWHLGVDGISLFLVVLTGVLFPLAILGATRTTTRSRYYAWLLLLEAGCIGVFLALDLFLFFVMFEIVLVPMYFLIGGLGLRPTGATRR